jgi:hypothetical protein
VALAVFTDVDNVLKIMEALATLQPAPAPVPAGLLPLDVAACLALVHPAWRAASARVPTRVDAADKKLWRLVDAAKLAPPRACRPCSPAPTWVPSTLGRSRPRGWMLAAPA